MNVRKKILDLRFIEIKTYIQIYTWNRGYTKVVDQTTWLPLTYFSTEVVMTRLNLSDMSTLPRATLH